MLWLASSLEHPMGSPWSPPWAPTLSEVTVCTTDQLSVLKDPGTWLGVCSSPSSGFMLVLSEDLKIFSTHQW